MWSIRHKSSQQVLHQHLFVLVPGNDFLFGHLMKGLRYRTRTLDKQIVKEMCAIPMKQILFERRISVQCNDDAFRTDLVQSRSIYNILTSARVCSLEISTQLCCTSLLYWSWKGIFLVPRSCTKSFDTSPYCHKMYFFACIPPCILVGNQIPWSKLWFWQDVVRTQVWNNNSISQVDWWKTCWETGFQWVCWCLLCMKSAFLKRTSLKLMVAIFSYNMTLCELNAFDHEKYWY